MLTIGITGGIGSGKSVTTDIAEIGVVTVDADKVAHRSRAGRSRPTTR